jgi:L-2,4-diaminobutyrate decarboxylase
MMGFTAYTILRTFSSNVIPQFIDRVYDLAREFASMIAQASGLELARQPESNIVCFRYTCEILSLEENNKLNVSIREELVKSGRYYIVQATIDKKVWLRVSLMNPFTSARDLESLLADVLHLAES